MIAVGVLVADAPDLAQLYMRISTLVLGPLRERGSIRIVSKLTVGGRALLRKVLARQEQHLLVESTDDWDLRLTLSGGRHR